MSCLPVLFAGVVGLTNCVGRTTGVVVLFLLLAVVVLAPGVGVKVDLSVTGVGVVLGTGVLLGGASVLLGTGVVAEVFAGVGLGVSG